jgi:glycosyltransferase involved in cell wall biosynthesis
MMFSEGTSQPRILILIKGLGIGGAERLVAEAVPFWNRSIFDYRVAYVLPWKDQLVPDLVNAQVTVDCIGGRSGLDLTTLWRLRRLLGEIDLVHAHLPATGILARLVSRVPVVYTEHNLAGSYRQPTRTLNRLTFGRNRAVTAVSSAVAESLDGFPGPAPVVVPNGVAVSIDDSQVADVRKDLGVSPTQPLVVHVGNIRPHKGHETLVNVASRLSKIVPDAVVVSAGGEKFPGDLARVRNLATAAGLSHQLRFLGRIEDARPLLAAADVVVNPADVEGLPLVLLEALALSRPVVATAVGGVPSVIIDGQTGRLVQPGDADALARAIAEVLADPKQGRKWGEAGARLVNTEYGVARMVQSFEDIYRALLSPE